MTPIEIAAGVTATPRFVSSENNGMLARISGLHDHYELARDFVDRSGPPWGWRLSALGLYEWRARTDDREGARFFVISGGIRRRVELVSRETAMAMARRMGKKG